jgi:2-desacetyl-2-hydroxyethyl bacteriochlorophyllide A dehydrogenase
MKAAVCREQNRLVVEDVAKPAAGPGQVILKVHACGICGSDLHAAQYGFTKPGESGSNYALSAIGNVMGHEFCGEIADIGPGVDGFRVGERVTSLPFLMCGECPACRRGEVLACQQFRIVGAGQTPGAYAEHVRCAASCLFKLPPQVNSRQGALIEPLSVSQGGVNRARLKPDSACVVMGAGPIGLGALLWCKARGVKTVVVSEPTPRRAELAATLGASAVVDPRKESPADKVRQLTGALPEVVFECVGAKSTLSSAIGLAGRGGQVVVLGYCMEPDQITPYECINKGLTIDFSAGYTPAEFGATIEALASGKIRAEPMITDVVSIDQLPAMFDTLHRPNNSAKVIIEFPG